jgi:hypothetical protein
MVFKYGMRLRPFGIGCQPMNGLEDVMDGVEKDGRHYWNVLIYSRELTEKELSNYELDRL